uniref:Large ribosomal subunit protein uL16c n=1 Tax=Bryopsis hypnoides TaxID=222885 RepID=D0EVS3_BRYHP|nr:50S ribosomal protein L16 [Bryopsis hypnoides]ACX33757.1 50S ribosomal protein L16 [Bryopsis hypnoides]
MLQPKRLKYRKHHRGRLKGRAKKGTRIYFGDFALQALEANWLTARQIEAARRVITRYTKRGGKLWIRTFPDKPVTMRAAETRMGSGKGNPEYWISVIKPGKILYELKGVPYSTAKKAFTNAAFKLPMKTKFISTGSQSIFNQS